MVSKPEKGEIKMTIAEQMKQLAREAKEAAAVMATLPSPVKDDTLRDMADELIRERAFLQRENERDLELAQERGLTAAMIDRLTLTEGRIADMAKGLREVASLPDPVGRVTTMWRRPNGLLVGRMRIPLGVIGIIYESRPNVTADAAALCLKAGNAVILRGGSERSIPTLPLPSCCEVWHGSMAFPPGLFRWFPLPIAPQSMPYSSVRRRSTSSSAGWGRLDPSGGERFTDPGD